MGIHYPVTLTPPIYADDRPFFAHMGSEIPRPSSAAPMYTAPHYSVPQRSFSGPMQLPGVSSLGQGVVPEAEILGVGSNPYQSRKASPR